MDLTSGLTTQQIPFIAVDATDLKTRETGLTGFTVYRSRNGGTLTAYTTPTIAESSSSNAPGLYWLLADEDTTISSGANEEAYVVHITHASMAPVTIECTLKRPIVTAGQTLTVTSGRANADMTHIAAAAVSTSSAQLGVNVVNAGGTAWATVITNLVSSIWSATTRILTAGTNIVLAKGTGVTGFNDLSAAQVNAEVDTAISDVGLTTTITGRIDAAISTRLASAGYTAPDNSGITAIKAKTDNLPASPAATGDIPTANQNADALLDLADGVETGISPRAAWRIIAAACAGKASGLDTNNPVYRGLGDTKDRITATTDQYGNRSAVTVDGS